MSYSSNNREDLTDNVTHSANLIYKTRYCQLIRNTNKEKRLQFALDHPDFHVTCNDCIFTDETTVQLEWHSRRCARMKGEQSKPKPKPKHPCKVHVWAGISSRGATQCVYFRAS